jgi:hypothetical protein
MAFVQINTRMLALDEVQLAVPPIADPPASLLGLNQTADIGPGTFDIQYTATPLGATEKLAIWIAVVDSHGINYVSNLYRLVGFSAAAQASPYDHQTQVEGRFGAMQVGQVVHLSVGTIDTATGLVSAPRTIQTVVVDTT